MARHVSMPGHAKYSDRRHPDALPSIVIMFATLLLSVPALSHASDSSCEDLAESLEADGVTLLARCGGPIDQEAARECRFSMTNQTYQYFPAEPVIHSIEGGNFVALCVMPEHYWFDAFLDTHSPGRMVIEIPKDAVNLKQFDFPHCLSPSNVWVRDDLNVPTESVTIKQVRETAHSRILLIEWDYPGVRMIAYGGSGISYRADGGIGIMEPPGLCINEYVDGGHDPSKSITDNSYYLESSKEFCYGDGYRRTAFDFVRNITGGSVEDSCVSEDFLTFVLDVENDGHLLLNVPRDFQTTPEIHLYFLGNYEPFYTARDRILLSEAAPHSGFTSEHDDPLKWKRNNPSLQFIILSERHVGPLPSNQLGVVVHSFDENSITIRVPLIKGDATFTVDLRDRDGWGIPTHVLEKYSVPPPASPRAQSASVPPEEILCRTYLVLAITHDDKGVCVKPSTAEVLLERGYLTEIIG